MLFDRDKLFFKKYTLHPIVHINWHYTGQHGNCTFCNLEYFLPFPERRAISLERCKTLNPRKCGPELNKRVKRIRLTGNLSQVVNIKRLPALIWKYAIRQDSIIYIYIHMIMQDFRFYLYTKLIVPIKYSPYPSMQSESPFA